MAAFQAAKVVSALPSTLTPDTIYLVRSGTGFNLFCSDATGSIAHGPSEATSITAGSMSATDKAKLDGVETFATSNATNTVLLARANHTGVQEISTITNLQTELNDKIGSAAVTAALATKADVGMIPAGTANTLDINSVGKEVPISGNITIPTNASVAYAIGSCILLRCDTTNRTITGPATNSLILEGSSASVTNFVLKANKSVIIRKTGTNSWRVYGDV